MIRTLFWKNLAIHTAKFVSHDHPKIICIYGVVYLCLWCTVFMVDICFQEQENKLTFPTQIVTRIINLWIKCNYSLYTLHFTLCVSSHAIIKGVFKSVSNSLLKPLPTSCRMPHIYSLHTKTISDWHINIYIYAVKGVPLKQMCAFTKQFYKFDIRNDFFCFHTKIKTKTASKKRCKIKYQNTKTNQKWLYYIK